MLFKSSVFLSGSFRIGFIIEVLRFSGIFAEKSIKLKKYRVEKIKDNVFYSWRVRIFY